MYEMKLHGAPYGDGGESGGAFASLDDATKNAKGVLHAGQYAIIWHGGEVVRTIRLDLIASRLEFRITDE